MKHDFIAVAQADYFNEMKNLISEGEFVITLDFAENYTCQTQDPIQSQHWSNVQATLHPYVVYFKRNNKIEHLHYVIISEHLQHDANSVHYFNCKLMDHLKNKFGSRNVRKVTYFSDGAGSQYKNKFNLINLTKHKEDFGVDAQWNFFVTSHGKGACDGIGGTVKRNAYKSSLQNKRITSQNFFTIGQKLFSKKFNLIFLR